ncbi:hypothetical protein ILYODFUR_010888 [Ilyodon furcidens]|uniref:Uncharacterized protein n=1 Tax=Ilyodon furcidens TaxID=33524 RepID=A0ABV0V241_9TELE
MMLPPLYFTVGLLCSGKGITVPGHVHHYTLENMSPGIYDIFIRATTIAGTGPAGNLANVHIVVLMLIFLLAQMKMVKQKLFQGVPDPANSTLSHWNPETSMESKKLVVEQDKPEVSYPEVFLLDKLQEVEKTHSFLRINNPQIFAYLQPSSPPAKASDKGYIRNMSKTQSVTDLSTSLCIYSNVLCSQFNQNLPPPLLPCSY